MAKRPSSKGKTSKKKTKKSPSEKNFFPVLKEYIELIIESAYEVAARFGFSGTFLNFLSQLQTALERTLKDKRISKISKFLPYH